MPAAAGIYYTEQGREMPGVPPLVLVHGAGMSHQVWPAQLRRLPGWHVLAVDLPGHGQSAGAGYQTVEALAESLAGFLDSLGTFSAVLIGHGLGGAISLAFAAHFPQRADALGILSAAWRFHLPRQLIDRLSVIGGTQAAGELFIELSSGSSTLASHTNKMRRLMQAARAGILRDDLLACDAFHLSLPQSAFSSPAILISGAQDQMISLADLRHLARYIPEAGVHILPECGHNPLVEQPVQVTALISEFLDEHFIKFSE